MLRAKHRLQSLVLANRDELHFRSDDSLPRVVHLSHIAARLGAEWLAKVGKAQRIQLPVSQPQTAVVRRNSGKFLSIATCIDPGAAERCNTFPDVDVNCRIGVRTAGVIDRNWWIVDFAVSRTVLLR